MTDIVTKTIIHYLTHVTFTLCMWGLLLVKKKKDAVVIVSKRYVVFGIRSNLAQLCFSFVVGGGIVAYVVGGRCGG